MSQLEEIRAVTWDGTASFPMLGLYGRDASGRFVLTREGRYQIPDDAIVLRSPAQTQQVSPPAEPSPVAEAPSAAEPPHPTEPQAPVSIADARDRRGRFTRRKA